MEVKKTSMNIPIDIADKLKLIAVAKKVTQAELINDYLKKCIDEDIDLVKSLLE